MRAGLTCGRGCGRKNCLNSLIALRSSASDAPLSAKCNRMPCRRWTSAGSDSTWSFTISEGLKSCRHTGQTWRESWLRHLEDTLVNGCIGKDKRCHSLDTEDMPARNGGRRLPGCIIVKGIQTHVAFRFRTQREHQPGFKRWMGERRMDVRRRLQRNA